MLAVGEGTGASGAVYSSGFGDLTIDVANGVVTGGSWTLDASSDGEIAKNGATAHVTGHVAITGAPAGTKDAVELTGNAVTTGQIRITVSGANVTTPLNGTIATTTKVTIVDASCEVIHATFLPDWNNKAGGQASIGGEFQWTGRKT